MLNISNKGRRFSAVLLTLSGAALAFSAAPASANSGDYRCTGLADQARSAAATAEGSKQKVAQRFLATGLKLCEARNARAAAQQFRSALKAAGVAEVEAQ